MSFEDGANIQKQKNTVKPELDEAKIDLSFTPEEEQKLLTESNEVKASANKLFASGGFSDAITQYNTAIASLPIYFEFQLAVLHANISACHIKLDEWKQAVESATQAIDGLNKLDPVPVDADTQGKSDEAGNDGKPRQSQDAAADKPAADEVDDDTELRLESLARTGHTIDDVRNIRVKALLRRAKARAEIDSWSSLQGAMEDYQQLSAMRGLSSTDAQTVRKALQSLPPRVEAAKQKDMAEMMGKLKQLGNGILKPFGLSTDNFNFIKDEKTGGYNLNFNQK